MGNNLTATKFFIMNTLNNIWENYTYEFSTSQKVIIGAVLSFILLVALLGIILLVAEAFV